MPFDSLPEVVQYDRIGQILIDAREFLVDQGWCQKAMMNENRELCAIGAITFAVETSDVSLPEMMADRNAALIRFSATLPGKTFKDAKTPARIAQKRIMYWNDRKSRRLNQVLAQFDVAISRSRISAELY
jgi:hypothetical protein